MKIFVAGGSGVLGRATLPPLVAAGHQVRATARGAQKLDAVRQLGADPIDLDLYDLAQVRRAISGADAVLRLTTKFGPMTQLRDARTWQETMRLRTEGARVLVDAALAEGVQVYVHESVSFVYADGGESWLTENDAVDDAGIAMMRATLAGEKEAERFTKGGGRGIVLRFAGFYSADAPSTLETIAAVHKRMFFQFGSGRNYFSSIYVPDAGRAVAAAVAAPAGIYNVVEDEPAVFADYVRTLAEAVGAPRQRRLPRIVGRLIFGEIFKSISRSQRVSNAKLKSATGWKPEVRSVREGWPRIASLLARRGAAGSIAA